MTRKQGYVTCNDKFLVMNVLIRLIQQRQCDQYNQIICIINIVLLFVVGGLPDPIRPVGPPVGPPVQPPIDPIIPDTRPARPPIHSGISPQRPPMIGSGPCAGNPFGILPDPQHCARYYNCSQRFQIAGLDSFQSECPYPQLYDTNLRVCNDFQEVQCGSRFKSMAPCKYNNPV